MSTHTPGPWEVSSGMVQTVAYRDIDYGVHIPIAYMDRTPGNGTLPVERDCNARLIAASPDLFAALNELLDAMPTSCDDGRLIEAQRKAEAAIRKAI